jgi:ubiquinone/menaquinone biosynthesis C-methylase UbiE
MTQAFARRFAKVWAFDVSSVMIEKAKAHWGHLKNVEFVLGNGQDLNPVENGSVDIVFSTLVLQHLPEPRLVLGYLEESGRVLRQGGIACHRLNTISHAAPRKWSRPGIELFFRKQIARLALLAPSVFKSSSTPLWRHYHDRYECFRGCSVTADAIESAARKAGMAVEQAIGSDSLETYYRFRKE